MHEHLTFRRSLLFVAAGLLAVTAVLGLGLGVLASDQQPSAASPAILFAYQAGSWGTEANGPAQPIAHLGVCRSGTAPGATQASTEARRPACTVSIAAPADAASADGAPAGGASADGAPAGAVTTS